MKLRVLLLSTTLLLLPMGCATATAPTPPLVPGALNQFDQTSYASLLTAQASYNSLLASYKANPTVLAPLKAPLDAAARAINLADTAWQAYHAAGAAATSTQQAAVTTALAAAQTSLAAVKP